MTSEIIGIENDQSQQVIDAVERALNDKGVILLVGFSNPEDGNALHWQGLGNKRIAITSFPSLKDLSNEQIQEKASEIVREVESKMRGGGDA